MKGSRKAGFGRAALLCAAAAALASCAAMKEASAKADQIEKIEIDDIDFSALRDGVYGYYADFGLDTAKVEARVENGSVAEVKVLEHKHGPGAKHSGAAVADRVVAAQSLRVDVVSGATGSSKVVLEAIEGALKKALPE